MNILTGSRRYFYHRFSSLILLPIFIAACSIMPESIERENLPQISVQAVQQNTDNYQGQTVRWGGIITQFINNADDTWIEVLSTELGSSGRPSSNRSNNQGRFIAKIDKFLDPEVYLEGNKLTIIGILAEKIDGKIGDFNYSFPVVVTQGHHLWPNRTYRQYPYITPGYWYYGFNPYWNFGYGYYGYGVIFNRGYYPYYPIFGHLQRHTQPLPANSMSGVFRPSRNIIWPTEINRYSMSRKVIANNNRPNVASRKDRNAYTAAQQRTKPATSHSAQQRQPRQYDESRRSVRSRKSRSNNQQEE